MLSNKYRTRMPGMIALAAAMMGSAITGAIAQSDTRNLALDAGSVIPVKLDNELSSNNTRKGDTFTVTLRNDADAEYYRLPTGTHIEGVVRDVRAKKDKDPGVLDLDFRRLRLPDGHSYAIQGSLIGLDSKSVEKRSDGRLIAKPGHSNDRLTYVGYGAGAGLIVGLLTKSTLQDTLLGGGLGYLFGSLQKGQTQTRDVDLKPGSELGVRLDQSVTLTNYGGRDDTSNYHARNDDTGRFHRDGATGNSTADNGADSRDNGNRVNNNNRNSSDNSGYRRDDNATRDNRGSTNDRNNSDRNRNDNTVNGDRADRLNQDRPGANQTGDRNSRRNIGVLVGDRNVPFDAAARPFVSNGVLMVPVRDVLNTAHIPFTYNAQTKSIRATGDGGTVRLALDSAIAVVNGDRRVRLDAPAQQVNGTTYVPVKFFSLVTGRDATYDTGSRTVQVTLKSDDNTQGGSH